MTKCTGTQLRWMFFLISKDRMAQLPTSTEEGQAVHCGHLELFRLEGQGEQEQHPQRD